MNEMIAYCGLACDSCPIHLATLEKDESTREEMRISIARICQEQYGMDIQAEDITDCDGCHVDTGRIFSGCLKCEIRKCAKGKGLENCAFCSEYACDILKEFLLHEPDAKARLEEIRKTNP